MTEADALVVVEDLAPVRAWLAGLLAELHPGVPVAQCATLAEAQEWLRAQDPRVRALCLVDLGLPDGSGVSFIAALSERLPDARAVVTTLYDDDRSVVSAMAAGAAGYLLKDGDDGSVARRLCAMRDGEVAISPAVSRRILAAFRGNAALFADTGSAGRLTAREEEVLRLIGRGLRNAEVAAALVISPQTVARYVKAVYRKLDLASRAEAAVEAMRCGLI